MLLDYGADINKMDARGATALLIATMRKQIDIVKLLIDKGANLFQANNNELTPLIAAIDSNSQEMISLFIPYINLHEANESSQGKLICVAVEKGNLDIVNTLLNGRTNPNTINYAGKSLLHLAAEQGHLMMIESLLEHGALINQTDRVGNTALYMAVDKGNSAIVSVLIHKGADVNMSNRHQTPLRHAVRLNKKYDETIHLLLKGGADLQKENLHPEDPLLCIAAYYGSLELVIALLDAGADINQAGVHYQQPFFNAIRSNCLPVVKALLERGVDTDTINNFHTTAPIHHAAENGNVELVAILLDLGANIEQPDIFGGTPLCVAINRGHLNVVTFLLEKGANLYPNKKTYRSPLSTAAYNGYEQIVVALLNANVDVNKPDTNGNTPLSNAINCKRLGCVKLLLDKHAEVNTVNDNGDSPLQIAMTNGSLDIIQLLLENHAHLAINPKHIEKAIKNGHHALVLYIQQLQKNRELFHHPCQLIQQVFSDYANSFANAAFFSPQTTHDKWLINRIRAPEFTDGVFDEVSLIRFLHQLKMKPSKPQNTLVSILQLCRLLTGIDYYRLPELPPLLMADHPSLAK